MQCPKCEGPAKEFGVNVGLCLADCGAFDALTAEIVKPVMRRNADGLLYLDLPTQDMPLSQAIRQLDKELEHGTYCLGCNRWAQVYWRNMYDKNALFMIGLFKLQEIKEDHYHLTEVADAVPGLSVRMTGGDVSKGAYWDLMELKGREGDDKGRTSGKWKLTAKGKLFVNDEIKIPKYAVTYDGEVIRFEGEEVGIQDILSAKFDYTELMLRMLNRRSA